MPIVVNTSKLRRPHTRSSRTRLSRTSAEKPFVPPGRVKHDMAVYHDDAPQPPPSLRSHSHERPVRLSQSSSLKPFVPAGTVKHPPVPASPPSFPLEGAGSSGGRGGARAAGQPALTPFFPSGTTHHPTSSTPPRRPPPFPLERDLHPNFLDEEAHKADKNNTASEYARAYQAWDLPPPRNPILPTHSSVLSNFDVHLSTAQWESETRSGYPAHAPRPSPSAYTHQQPAQSAIPHVPATHPAPVSHPPYARDTTLAAPLSEYDEQTRSLRERLQRIRERGEGAGEGEGRVFGEKSRGGQQQHPSYFAFQQPA
eukprot:gene40190-48972_t